MEIITTLVLDTPFLGTRRINDGVAYEYVWRSHKEVRQSIENYGRGLVSLGLGRQKAIGVYSINRPEWVSDMRVVVKELFFFGGEPFLTFHLW